MNLLVVTPTLGASRFLESTIASVHAAGRDLIHILVAPEVKIAAVSEVSGRSRVVPDHAAGMYEAINAGIAAAAADSWDWFTYLNDDDTWQAAGMRVMADSLEKQKRNIDVCYGRVALINTNGATIGELPVARNAPDIAHLLSAGIVPLAQPGTLVRRSLLEKIGGFDNSFRSAGDLDFWVRAAGAGARFGFVSMRVASFRLHADQLSKQRDLGEQERFRALSPIARPWGLRSAVALLRFRMGNLPVYFDRIRRHGWIPMRTLYDRADK